MGRKHSKANTHQIHDDESHQVVENHDEKIESIPIASKIATSNDNDSKPHGEIQPQITLPVILYARLAKTVKFLDSVRGTDKVLMFIQYFSKILIWKLTHKGDKSGLAVSLANLAAPVSDFRILLRYYGLLPLIQWAVLSEQSPSPSPKIQLLVRLQNVMNFLYYPLEHIYWLGAHKIVSLSEEKINRIGIWSCRFWAAYVVLYFAQLWEEYKILKLKEKSLRLAVKTASSNTDEKLVDIQKKEIKDIKTAKCNLLVNTIINTAYFPLTIHWSLENSSFPDVGVGICGTIASIAQLYTAWKST